LNIIRNGWIIFFSLTNGSCKDELLTREQKTLLNEESNQAKILIKTPEEYIVDKESILSPLDLTNIIQEQQLCTQNLSEIFSSVNEFVYILLSFIKFLFSSYSQCLQNASNLRSRKIKKKRSILSTDKLPSTHIPTATPNGDLFIKLIECLRDPKLSAFKYIFILVCLCFSLLIIFIHK